MGLFLCLWKGGRQIIQHPVCFPTALVDIQCGTSRQLAMLTLPGIRPRVATTVPSDCLRHGDARIGEPRVPLLRFSSRLHSVVLPWYVLAWGSAGILSRSQRTFVCAILLQSRTDFMFHGNVRFGEQVPWLT